MKEENKNSAAVALTDEGMVPLTGVVAFEDGRRMSDVGCRTWDAGRRTWNVKGRNSRPNWLSAARNRVVSRVLLIFKPQTPNSKLQTPHPRPQTSNTMGAR